MEKLKTLNVGLTEKVASLQGKTGKEDVSLLRKELDAQKKKVAEVNLDAAIYWQKQFQTRFILHPPPSLKSISKHSTPWRSF